jgi:hypothetical protein
VDSNPVRSRKELLREEERLRERVREATRSLDGTRFERDRLLSLARSLGPTSDGTFALGKALRAHTAAVHELNQAVHDLQAFLNRHGGLAAHRTDTSEAD